MEVWTTGAASPRGILKLARTVEGNRWDGLAVVDGCLRLTPRGLAVADAVVRSLDLGLV